MTPKIHLNIIKNLIKTQHQKIINLLLIENHHPKITPTPHYPPKPHYKGQKNNLFRFLIRLQDRFLTPQGKKKP